MDNINLNDDGQKLFDAFEEGKDIDDINEMIASSDEEAKEPLNEEVIVENDEVSDGDNKTDEIQPGGDGNIPLQDNTKIISDVKNDKADKEEDILFYLSSVLGVDKDKALEELKRKHYEIEAEKEGITDVDLYIQKKETDRQNEAFLRQRAEENFKNAFMNDISNQLLTLKGQNPEFDMDKACDNDKFVSLLGLFYRNEATKDNALDLAYNTVFFNERIAKEREKIINSIKSGKMRMVEGALNTSNENEGAIDVNTMSDDMIDSLKEKVLNGEKVNLV